MGKNKKWIQILILSAVAIIGALAIGQSLFLDTAIPKVGSKVPSFQLMGTDNEKHDIADYEGKVVVLNFWGTFCEPCKREMPAIQRQYDKWQDQGVSVIGINLGESAVTAHSFIREHNLTFLTLFDSDLSIRNRYGVKQYPTTFFINREGRIEAIRIGEMEETFIDQTLMGMLTGK